MHSWINQSLIWKKAGFLCLCLCFLAGNAQAFNASEQDQYSAGKDALKTEKYPEALVIFGDLLESLRLNNEDRWQVIVAIAVTHDKAGNLVAALEYYERFLRALTPLLPEAEQKWRDRYELAVQTRHDIQARLSKTHARISLDSDPSGAVILIDGKPAGVDRDAITPFVAYVKPGPHLFEMKIDGPKGRILVEKTIHAASNQPESWVASMRKSSILLDTLPEALIQEDMAFSQPYQTGGWSLVGLGIAAGITGVVFTAEANHTHDELGTLSIQHSVVPETAAAQWDQLNQELENQELTSWIFYGLGAALLGTGAGLLSIYETVDTEGESTSQIALLPTGLGASAIWAF